MLFVYDVLCYIVLVIKLWLIKGVGADYIFENYRQMDQKHKQAEMQSILQNCVENNGNINVRAINTYIEWLFIYLKESVAKKMMVSMMKRGFMVKYVGLLMIVWIN